MYKNEEEMPKQPKQGGKAMNCHGCMDFKKEAADQAYGQAGMKGLKSDMQKIHAQYYNGAFSSDSSSEY